MSTPPRHVRQAIKAAGLTIVDCEYSKHVKVRVQRDDGTDTLFVFKAGTREAAHNERNIAAQLRAFAEDRGTYRRRPQ